MRKEFTFDRVVRMVIGLLILVGIIWLIDILRGVLLPFFVACLIAYVFEPFVQYNRQLLHLKGRVVAVFVTLFEALTFIFLFCWFVGPLVANEISEMADIMKQYAASELHGNIVPESVHRFLRRTINFTKISHSLSSVEWVSVIENALHASWGIISGGLVIILGVFNWLIVILYVIFIMIDYERLNRGMRNMVPPKYRPAVYGVANDIKSSMNHYFRGQALIALIVGILFSIGFLIIGMPMAIVFGMFIGLLNLVPYLQLISLIPAVGLCIVCSASGEISFWSIFLQCIAVYCIVQAIQDLFLTPKIMGKAMGLNPAIILLSLSIWGTLLGFIGLIIALPLTTLLLSYYEHYITGTGLPWRKREAESLKDVIEKPLD